MLFDDVDGSVENANWFAREPFLAGYDQVETGFLAVHPDDSQFIVVYSTWSLPGGIGAFFQSVANDVEGIGFAHIANEDPIIPAEFFDDTPNSQVVGMLHMNRWTQYLGADPGGTNDNTISLIFGQELGHAWASFVYFNQGMGWETGMLGRANAHWSFYMHTGGSPLQGHEWIDNGDGTFTAVKQELFTFSDLDLYLMGMLPPEEVEPWFVLEDPFDCFDAAAGDDVCAPPQAFSFKADTYTVGATRRDISIADVIAVEGARSPAYPDAPTDHDVSFVLIKRPDEVLDEDELAAMDTIIARSVELFEMQTGGRGRVINRTSVVEPPGNDDGSTTDSPGDSGDGNSGGVDETGGSGNGNDSAATEGSGSGDDDTAATNPGQGGGDESGCACSTSTSTPSNTPAFLWLLAGLGLAIRRRSCASTQQPRRS